MDVDGGGVEGPRLDDVLVASDGRRRVPGELQDAPEQQRRRDEGFVAGGHLLEHRQGPVQAPLPGPEAPRLVELAGALEGVGGLLELAQLGEEGGSPLRGASPEVEVGGLGGLAEALPQLGGPQELPSPLQEQGGPLRVAEAPGGEQGPVVVPSAEEGLRKPVEGLRREVMEPQQRVAHLGAAGGDEGGGLVDGSGLQAPEHLGTDLLCGEELLGRRGAKIKLRIVGGGGIHRGQAPG